MQIFGTSGLFGSSQAQGLLGALFQPGAATTGQSSPVGDDSPATLTAKTLPGQAPAQRFAASTLASLLSLQEQPQSAGASASTLANSVVSQFG